jgi:predicted dienelactone hydrolase
MRRLLPLILLLCTPALAAARPDFTQPGPLPVGRRIVPFTKRSETTGEPRELDTFIWYPAVAGSAAPGAVANDAPIAEQRWPLIMFSHGSCGLPAQSPFYVETLASWGFIVAAPPHPGNEVTDPQCTGQAPSDEADSYLNRVADIRFVLDALLADAEDPTSPFYRRIDPRRIGMSGHSFGGQTTLRVAAADPRIRGAVALAPAAPPPGLLVRTPTMIMGSELDSLVPYDTEIQTGYASLQGPRFLVELLDTGHCAYAVACLPEFCGAGCEPGTISDQTAHDLTLHYALPFFLKYVAGNGRFASDLEPGTEPPFSVVRHAVPGPPPPPRTLPAR